MSLSTAYSSSVSIARPDNTTAYGALDVIGRADAETAANAGDAILEFAGIAPPGGGAIVLAGANIRFDVNAVPSGMAGMRLHLYSAAPAAVLDAATFNLVEADRSKYLGFIDIGTPVDHGDTLFIQNDALAKQVIAASASLFGVLQTVGGYTPAATTVMAITLQSRRL